MSLSFKSWDLRRFSRHQMGMKKIAKSKTINIPPMRMMFHAARVYLLFVGSNLKQNMTACSITLPILPLLASSKLSFKVLGSI